VASYGTCNAVHTPQGRTRRGFYTNDDDNKNNNNSENVNEMTMTTTTIVKMQTTMTTTTTTISKTGKATTTAEAKAMEMEMATTTTILRVLHLIFTNNERVEQYCTTSEYYNKVTFPRRSLLWPKLHEPELLQPHHGRAQRGLTCHHPLSCWIPTCEPCKRCRQVRGCQYC